MDELRVVERHDQRFQRVSERQRNGRVRTAFTSSPGLSDRGLGPALRDAVKGEVRFDAASRALYATDSSNYRQPPIGLVIPKTIDDVIATIRICRERGAPVLPRGSGTSLAGQCCNTAVVIDYSKYVNRIIEVDIERRLARVEPGVVLDRLRDAAEQHHLTFGPDPSTHDHNTLGGMLGNNSCGVHSVMAGRTADNVESLDILTYDGLRFDVGPTSDEEMRAIAAGSDRRAEIYRRLDALRRRYADLIRARYPRIPRRVSGYNLDELLPEKGCNIARALVGSEGTCVAILGATLRLVPSPPCRTLVAIGYDSVFEAGDAVPRVLEAGPIGLEGIDQELVTFMREKHLREEDVKLLPEGHGWLLAEFGGESDEDARAHAEALVAALKTAQPRPRSVKLMLGREEQDKIWRVRRSGLGATAFVPHHPDTWAGWEDSAVAPDKVGNYLRDLKALFKKYSYDAALYGHFGDGCIHCRIDFGLRNEDGIAAWRNFLDEAAALVVRYGGSLSGEHGDGQSKAELLQKMYGPELLAAFREFKAIWDPEGGMNPGKIVEPYPITSNLRVGPDYRPRHSKTYFAFANDHGSFAHAALRCVGVGECRRQDSKEGVMCPSYMVTREEQHVTRGRARMLFEMLHGGIIGTDWRNDAVEDALSLCLACKGCKSDCPVNVDMATYKAEFRAHHYHGRLRPRVAYSMGLVQYWARLAQAAPGLVNLATHTPGLSHLVKFAAGIAPARNIPKFARESFTHWMRHRAPANPEGPRVILWPDTFNNHFRPRTAIAAVKVLEARGWRVEIPNTWLCCGRPLYDWGMLDLARHSLRRIVDALRQDIQEQVPVVGLEPACVSAFKDELLGLLPGDETAKRLAAQTLMFGDFLAQHEIALPPLGGRALVQLHCHHHAIIKPGGEEKTLKALGLDYEMLPSGCCGMAGSFGFEADKYDVSQACAERVLLPAVRGVPEEVRILADGFSCREQIEQATGRPTLHLAELVAEALGV